MSSHPFVTTGRRGCAIYCCCSVASDFIQSVSGQSQTRDTQRVPIHFTALHSSYGTTGYGQANCTIHTANIHRARFRSVYVLWNQHQSTSTICTNTAQGTHRETRFSATFLHRIPPRSSTHHKEDSHTQPQETSPRLANSHTNTPKLADDPAHDPHTQQFLQSSTNHTNHLPSRIHYPRRTRSRHRTPTHRNHPPQAIHAQSKNSPKTIARQPSSSSVRILFFLSIHHHRGLPRPRMAGWYTSQVKRLRQSHDYDTTKSVVHQQTHTSHFPVSPYSCVCVCACV